MSEKAKQNLIAYQTKHKLTTRDEALEQILEHVKIWEGQQEVIASLQARTEELQSRIDNE